MSEARTPDEVADEIRKEISRSVVAAAPLFVSVAVDGLLDSDQPLAAWHVLRGYGVSESQTLAVFEKSGIGAEVLDLLLIPDLLDE